MGQFVDMGVRILVVGLYIMCIEQDAGLDARPLGCKSADTLA